MKLHDSPYVFIRFSAHMESRASTPLYVTLAAKIVNVRLRQINIAPRNPNLGNTTGTRVQR